MHLDIAPHICFAQFMNLTLQTSRFSSDREAIRSQVWFYAKSVHVLIQLFKFGRNFLYAFIQISSNLDIPLVYIFRLISIRFMK